jgi:hypothetical protein
MGEFGKMEIEIWNNQQMQEHIDRKDYPVDRLPYMSEHFKGFTYFSPDFVEFRFKTEDSTKNSKKDRAVVALENTDLVGIFSFLWMKGEYDFEHYYPRFVDVTKDKRSQGIGTALVKRLNKPCFLWGKTLMVMEGSYTRDGNDYIKKVIERELTGEHFKIVNGMMTRLEDYDILINGGVSHE